MCKMATTEEALKKSRRFKPKFKINRKTVPLKLILFLYFGAMASILPYLTLHMRDIGITIEEVAVIYAILPFTSFIGPPLLGALADALGNYKWVLVLSTFCTGFFHTLLLFVPLFKSESTKSIPLNIHWVPSFGNLEPFLVPSYNLSTENCQEFTKRFSDESIVERLSLLYFNCSETLAEVPSNCSIALSLNSKIIAQNKWNSGLSYTCGTNESFESVIESMGSNSATFWIYFLIRIIGTIFLASCFSLIDATTIAVVKENGKAEYGKERIWSIVGSAIFSPIAGILVDRFSAGKLSIDYMPAFVLSNILLIVSIIIFIIIELKVEKPEKGVIQNAMELFKYPEVVVFLVMIFLLGNLWGFVESYLFIFLKELKAPNYLLGLTLTVGSVVGIPFLWGAEAIVNRVGRVNLIILAFFTYFLRYFGYSYLNDPFWCFPFEAMEVFTYHLMWTASATYCALLAPKGLLASLMGIMGSLHYSLGKGSGSFLGGFAFGQVGARLSFRYFGIAAGILGIFFFLIDFIWIRKVVKRRKAREALETHEKQMRRESIIDPSEYGQTVNVAEIIENEEENEQELNEISDEQQTKTKMLPQKTTH